MKVVVCPKYGPPDVLQIKEVSKLKTACKKSLKNPKKYVSIDDGDLKIDVKRMDKIKSYVEKGIIVPVMDKTYKIEDIIEAHKYVEKGHKKGGVAITISKN
jgi:alcohol dehydrogenase